MALLGESTESSQVCSKFRLSPAMVRTSRLAARLFALLTLTKWKKVYNYKTKNSTEKIETKNHYFYMKKFMDDFVKIVSDSDCQANFLALITGIAILLTAYPTFNRVTISNL